MIYVIELTAAVDGTGTEQRFYLGTEAFLSLPNDSTPNIAFDARVIDPGSIGLHAFSDGRTGGATRLELGELKFANADGAFDIWKDYGFDGRRCVIRAGQAGAAYDSFRTLATCAAAAVNVTTDEVIVSLTDKAMILDRPVLTLAYAGTNEDGDGLEGTPDDVAGRLKPLVLGATPNISPPSPNTSYLVFQVSTGAVAAIGAVYDRGEPLDFGADHADSDALMAATIAGGAYDTCLAEGLFRLGASPLGQPTADVTASADVAAMGAAGLTRLLLLRAGLTEAEISLPDLDQLGAQAPEVLGRYVEDGATFRAVLDEVFNSIGGWYAFDALGVFRCGILEAPSEAAVADILDGEVLEGFERRSADGDGIPVWKVTVRHSRNWTVQTSDLAGDVDDARRAFLAQAYRTVAAEDPTVKDQFKLAGELTIDSLMTAAADAQAEAQRRLALHRVRRDIFDTPVQIGALPGEDALQIMATARLSHTRFGLSAGRNLRILGRTLELGDDRLILQMWG